MTDYFWKLNMIMVFTTIWIVHKYIKILFQKRPDNHYLSIGLWVLFYLFQVYAEFEKGTASLVVLLINILLVTLISISGYGGTIRQKLLYIVLLYAVWMILEVFSIDIVHLLDVNVFGFEMLGSIFSKLMMIVFVNILNIQVQKRSLNPTTSRYSMVLLIVPVSSIYLVYNLFVLGYNREEFTLNYMVSFTLLFIINIIIYEIYLKLAKNAILEKENALFAQQLELLPKYTRQQVKTVMDLKNIQHDLKNQLLGLKYLIQQNDMDGTLDVLNGLLNICDTNIKNISNSGNEIIDTVVNYKYSIAKEENINFNIKIFVPQELSIRETDLSVLLGNILDNAIESAKECENKYVDISMGVKNNALIIVVKNPFIKIVRDKNGSFMSTKKDKDNHGFGLVSVRKIMEKYNGELMIETENQEFVLTVLLEI